MFHIIDILVVSGLLSNCCIIFYFSIYSGNRRACFLEEFYWTFLLYVFWSVINSLSNRQSHLNSLFFILVVFSVKMIMCSTCTGWFQHSSLRLFLIFNWDHIHIENLSVCKTLDMLEILTNYLIPECS